MFDLSVIVPFRCENEDSIYLLERLEELCSLFPEHEKIEFIVIDSGSSPKYSKECLAICEKNNCKYFFEDTRGQTFSLGGCRDYGVQNALGRAITFLDVDLRMSPSFWDRLLILMKSWGISYYKKSFLAVPCLYLSREGTEQFLTQAESEEKYQTFYLQYLQGQNYNIESFAACSSVMIVDKLHYLSIGGHNPEFKGHGYEDFELFHRLLAEEDIIPRAENYLNDTKTWNTSTYNGFRSQFSIIAKPALAMNLMVFHVWHPRPKSSSFYDPKKLEENRKRIFKSFENFDNNKIHPIPLVDLSLSNKKVLYFGKVNTDAFNALRNAFPLLGEVKCVSEVDFVNLNIGEVRPEFKEMLTLMDISMVIFPNPYGNLARHKIYTWCKENNFPYVCFERGALPDSWFFDVMWG